MLLLMIWVVLSGDADAGHRVWPDAPICGSRQDCVLDKAATSCHFDPGQGDWGPMFTPGTTCACRNDACVVDKVEPVRCKSDLDCSYTHEPYLRPVSSKEVKRPHAGKVRPCVDAEMDAVCNAQSKTCQIVAWRC